MYKRVLIAAMFALALVPVAQAGETVAEPGQWYFSPMIGGNFEDKERNSDLGITGSLGLGRQLSRNWALEGSVFGGMHDGFNELGLIGWELDLVAILDTPVATKPYMLLGFGYLQSDVTEHPSVPVELNAKDAIGSIGFGLLAPLGNSATRLRADLRFRRDLGDTEHIDTVLQLGLYHAFGQAASRYPIKLPDSDGDKVADDVDRCPATPAGATVDRFGCETDNDRDGIADSRDRCPGTPARTAVDASGCPQFVDADGDGVADRDDRCPNTPRTTRVGADGCEPDSDGDGVADSRDRCPNSEAGGRIDANGCEIREKIELPGVAFELNSAQLKAGSATVLEQAVATLQRNPDLRVEAAGYTDSSGPADYNRNLSQRRADAVRQFLVARGVGAGRITARGYGEADPIADNSTREGRSRNRRVELRVLN